jgi:heat shock protein HslJ
VRRLALVAAVLLAASCGRAADAPAPPGAAPADRSAHEGSWELVSGRGPDGAVPVLDRHPITLEIDGSAANGRAACNLYGGRVEVDGSSFTAAGMGGTDMGCAPDVMESEARYHAALLAADRIEVAGDEMTLTGSGTELVFRRLPPVPTARLVGTTWKLESLIDGTGPDVVAVAAAPADLTLSDDGTFSGSTGCRELTGSWSENGGEIFFDEMRADGTCEESLREQDSHVVGVLGDGFPVEIEENTLTIDKPRMGKGLVYLAD